MGAPSICCNHGICVGTTLLLGRSLLPSLLPSEVFHQPLGCVWGCRCHLCLRGSGRARGGHRAMMLSDRSPGCTCPAGQKRVNSDLPPSQKLFVCPVGGWGAAPIQAGDRSRDGISHWLLPVGTAPSCRYSPAPGQRQHLLMEKTQGEGIQACLALLSS